MRVSDRRGVTLVELMIATAVFSIGVLGLVATFGKVQRGFQMSRTKTLASNLAQEKMQIIKQQTYFRVVPTMTPSFLADGTPYDTVFFPPETITEGGVSFQRYTDVQVVVENGGALSVLSPASPDTGMRQITVTVAWREGGRGNQLSISSVMANPNTVESNSVFTGTVKDSLTNLPISNAVVNVAENVGWRGLADVTGAYAIRLSPGSFNLAATADGYFGQQVYLAVGPNNTVTQNFLLTAMSSGSVVGTPWVNPAVVISQVVVSTPQSNGYDVEYVELFNPTPNAVAVNGALNLHFAGWNSNRQCDNIPLTYVNAAIPAYSYYLVSNTTAFTVNGVTIAADAYYTDTANVSCSPNAPGWNPPTVRSIADRHHGGTWWLTDASGNTVDAVGWTQNGLTHSPSYCLGTCFFTTGGLDAGWELLRFSSPTLVGSAYGRAYKSGDNSIDFTTSTTLQYSPMNSAAGPQTVIAGMPAVAAVVSASDGLSSPASAVSSKLYNYWPVASFALTKVATGTWTVLITSGSYEVENDTVTVAASGSVYVFPSSTTVLNQPATAGFVSGQVTDALLAPISAPFAIQVTGGGVTGGASAASGRYILRVPSGKIDVTANPNFANPYYVSASSLGVTVGLGQIASGVNFVLSQGGRISGWVTRDGVNGLQGITMIATDANGNTQDQEVTDVNGNFKTVNMATGTYTVRIPLDTTEVSTPTTASAVVLLGQTVSVGTFTITGALGTIAGNVTLGGSPISTGILIVVATGTLPGGPPILSSTTLTGGSYYVTSSKEDGSYSVDVRQSTYNVYGYYTTISNFGTVGITQQLIANVPVVAGQTVSGKNLAW